MSSLLGASLAGQTKVDLEAIPQIGGQNLYEIDLDSADKPWRLPGNHDDTGFWITVVSYLVGVSLGNIVDTM